LPAGEIGLEVVFNADKACFVSTKILSN
jgi:hypothetical protein